MQVAVVDDADADARSLIQYLEQFSQDTAVALDVRRFDGAGEFFAAKTSEFSLVILDIDMPGMNGVECAHVIRETDPDVVIMFVTNLPQYALAGYEVEAVDYVIKPLTYSEFSLKMKKALRYVSQNREKSVVLKTREGVVTLSVWEIMYVESTRHYLDYHTKSQVIRVRATMSGAEAELAGSHFARCNSGYLVNLRYVERICGDELHVGGDVLKISRGRRAAFMEAFARFAGGI